MADFDANRIAVNIDFSATGATAVANAVKNVQRMLADMGQMNAAMMSATGKAMPGIAQQTAALQMLAKQGDGVAKSMLAAQQGSKMFYQIFSGNVKQNLAQFFRSHQAFKTSMSNFRQELGTVVHENKEYGKAMSLNTDRILQQRLALTVLTERFDRIGQSLIKVGKNMQWTGRQLIVGITAPFIAATAIFGKFALDVSRSTTEVQKFLLQSGQSAEEVAVIFDEKIKPALEETAKATGLNINEVNDMAASWVAAGYDLNSGLDVLTDLTAKLTLLTAGDIDAAEAFELVRSVMASFGMTTQEVTMAIKQMQLIQSATSLQMADMARSFPKTASVANTLRLSFVETAAALAGMRERGIQASEAANALKTILSRIAAPTEAAKEVFQGIIGKDLEKFVFSPTGKAKGVDIITRLAEAMSTLNDQEKARLSVAIAGQRQVDRFTKLIQSAIDPASDFAVAIREGNKEAKAARVWQEQLAVVTNSLANIWDKLKTRLGIAAATIGEKLLPAINSLTERMVSLFETIANMPDGVVESFVRIAGTLATLGPITYIIGQGFLSLGTIITGLAKPFSRLFHATGVEDPAALARFAAFGGATSVGAGLPFAGGATTIGATAGAQALIAAAHAGANVDPNLLASAYQELGGRLRAPAGGMTVAGKFYQGGQYMPNVGAEAAQQMAAQTRRPLWHRLLYGKGKQLSIEAQKAGATLGTNFGAGATETLEKPGFIMRMKNAIKGMFGTRTESFMVPGMIAGQQVAITTKFSSILGKLMLILPLAIVALANWKEIWKGLQPTLAKTGEIWRNAFHSIAESIVGFVRGSEEAESSTNIWRDFGEIVGQAIQSLSRILSEALKVIGRFGIGPIVAVFAEMGEAFASFAKFLKNPIEGLKEFITGIFDMGTVSGFVLGVLGRLLAVITSFIIIGKVVAWVVLLQRAMIAAAAAATIATGTIRSFGAALAAIEWKSVILAIAKLALLAATAFGVFASESIKSLDQLKSALEGVKSNFTSLVDSIKEGTRGVTNALESFAGTFSQSIQGAAEEALDFGKGQSNFADFLNTESFLWILDQFDAVKEAFAKGGFTGVLNEAISAAIDGIIDGEKHLGIITKIIKSFQNATTNASKAMMAELIPSLLELNKLSIGARLQAPEAIQERIDTLKQTREILREELATTENKKLQRILLEQILQTTVAIKTMTASITFIGDQITEDLEDADFRKTLAGKIDELIDSSKEGGEKAGKALGEAYQDALKEQLDRLTGRVTESILSAFDEMADAAVDAIDKQIEKIREQDEEEERLQKNREWRRRRQELLEKGALDDAIAARERAKALAEGRFDDARIIALQALEQQGETEEELRQLDEEQRQARRDDRRETRISKLEDQKEKMQEMFREQRELLSNMLDDITQFGAENVKEWNSMYGEISNLAGQFGVDVTSINKDFLKRFGQTIDSGLTSAMSNAKKIAAREAEDMGKTMSEAAAKALADPEIMEKLKKLSDLLKEYSKTMAAAEKRGGNLDAINAKFIPKITRLFGQLRSSKGGRSVLNEFHEGGLIGGEKARDVPIMAQEGEYVLNRHSVRKLGKRALDRLNKYHEGGMVNMPFGGHAEYLTHLPATGFAPIAAMVPMATSIIGSGIKNILLNNMANWFTSLSGEAVEGFTTAAKGAMVTGAGIFKVAPVDAPVAFWNDFGAPRSGGRTHQGNDIFVANKGGGIIPAGVANTGRIIRASFAGNLSTSSGGELAGNSYVLSGDEGYAFGAHLYRHLKGSGQVKAGEPIGIVGNTGNAIGTAPHLHFEWHPRGGGAVNPFTILSNLYGNLNYGKGQTYGTAKPPANDTSQSGMAGSKDKWGKTQEDVAMSIRAGKTMASNKGWAGRQWDSLYKLWASESGWRWWADNPTSSAYGIPQSLPGSKMASAGADWLTNPITQIKWGLGYIADRYGGPNAAWAFKQANNWYHKGGLVPLASGGIVKFDTPALLHAGETVIPSNVTQALSRAAGDKADNVIINVEIGQMFGDETSYRKLHRTLENVGRKIARDRGMGSTSYTVR